MKIKNLLLSAIALSSILYLLPQNVFANSLEDIIFNQEGNKIYSMTENDTVTTNLYTGGEYKMKPDSLCINGNSHTIDGNEHKGFIVGNGQNLSINDVTVKNFKKQRGTVADESGAFVFNYGGHIENFTGTFQNNNGYNGGVLTAENGTINKIDGVFQNNTAYYGGAIVNDSKTVTNSINGIFKNNTAESEGGAIVNEYNGVIKLLTGTFESNSTQGFGGAISNTYSIINEIKAEFKNNSASMIGGAIHNGMMDHAVSYLNSIEGIFENNTALIGGAISNMQGFVNVVANTQNTIFTGNKGANGPNAIINMVGMVNLNANDGKSIIINDGIGLNIDEYIEMYKQIMPDLTEQDITNMKAEAEIMLNNTNSIYNINGNKENIRPIAQKLVIAGKEIDSQMFRGEFEDVLEKANIPNFTKGTVEINNKVKNATVNMFDGTLKLGTNVQDGVEYAGTFDKDVNFNYYGGKVTLQNGGINHANFGNMTLNSEMDLSLDADLANEKMDTISADKFTSNDNKINISNINLISGAKKSLSLSPLSNDMDAETRQTMAESIIYSGGDVAYGDIYKYTVDYNKENAMLNFGLQGGKSNPTDLSDFAPAVASKPIAQSGAQNVQMDSYTEAFRNMDMFMLMPENERIAYKYRNKYAALTDDLVYDPTMSTYQNNTAWFRPYTTFEKVDLKNGPEVSNTSYGTYFGYDSSLTELGKGWDGTFGVYAGYNGSHQTFHGNSIYQNGGSLGVIGVAYKGNFFTGWTLNVGASAGSTSNMYGSDNFTSIMGGLSTKNGYNFEFADGKFILQPSVLLSYSLVNTFDYTNAAGVRMKSDPLHTLQIEPSIKLIGNIGTWQPYANVAMVWNVLNETKVTANDVVLPEVSVKPYVKYGVGLQKKWADKFTAFGQCYVTNGGRNGVGLQAGLRIALGDETTKAKAAWLNPKKKDTVIVLDGKVK